jgi:adenine-specific DNA methylase
MRLVPLKDDGTADVDFLNAEFSKEYMADKRNPRWVAKPTVAYLWARTVICKNCRATVPLLKTRWLCKKANKRVLLAIEVEQASGLLPDGNRDGCPTLTFGIENDVPVKGGNAAQRREHDKRIGAGTMSRSGAKCPCCPTIMTMEDIKLEGKAGRLSSVHTAVVVDGMGGREYRAPTHHELGLLGDIRREAQEVFGQLDFSAPDDLIVEDAKRNTWCVQYGIDTFSKLFTDRQLLSLATLVVNVRKVQNSAANLKYAQYWGEAMAALLASAIDRLADRCSTVCRPDPSPKQSGVINTFSRFALPVTWDYIEGNPLQNSSGGFSHCLEWICLVADHANDLLGAPAPQVIRQSALQINGEGYDIVCTDPPYYDAIGYSVLMDFFYVWLRRTLHGFSPEMDSAFHEPLSPKWNHHQNDGELIDDASRHEGNKTKSKAVYEDGMGRAFQACAAALNPDGKMVVVFANKQPEAWETLVSAIIRTGFTVDGSWPIQTEMGNRTRALSSAALASSVWLVCKKRPETARPGWDNRVLEEMRANITTRLREFWDAGIRGPDFVWAATGPALEAYSKHPIVKKANDPGKTLEVGEFLSHVRRMVVDYVVGQVIVGQASGLPSGATETVAPPIDNLDAPTAYYLLHRHDFGLEDAPSGACILYATACGLSDSDLESTWDILVRTGSRSSQDEDEENEEDEDADQDAEADPDSASDSGSQVKLKTWAQRKHKSMGYEAPGGQPVPLIDRIHRLMHLWRAGDVLKVDEYLDEYGLRRQELFKRLLQSLIELSRKDGESQELQTLESLSNHVQAKGATPEDHQARLFVTERAEEDH